MWPFHATLCCAVFAVAGSALAADCDTSGELDFLCFQNAFAGCP
jgi:hypothetical protein